MNNIPRERYYQAAGLLLLHTITLILLAVLMDGLVISSLGSAIGVAIAYTVAQLAFWIIFIRFFTWLPTFLFPLLTFVLTGVSVYVIANWIPGITIENARTGLWITIWISVVDAIVGGFIPLGNESVFDRQVTERMIKKSGQAVHSDVPGFLFLEIDGLGIEKLKIALEKGYMPNLKRWIESGSHTLTGWETDFSAQTGAMQMGILMGTNDEIPAYRWWDRDKKKIVMSGNPKDALMLEKLNSTGRGLLSGGGASRGNMFSGDAKETILTISHVTNKGHERGPGMYFYLFSPYVVARILTRFIFEILVEWKDAWLQKRRKDIYRISARNPGYALLRAFLSPFLQDLVTYMVNSDVLRGMPAIYALYAGYDDLCHFAGIHAPEALKSLRETDRYLARIENTVKRAPRPYHVIVLSDHGQTLGQTFKAVYDIWLEDLVDGLMKGEGDVYVGQKTHETWDKLNGLLTDSVNENTRSAKFVESLVKSKEKEGYVDLGPAKDAVEDEKAREKKVVVVGSGCAGLIYFTHNAERLTSEQIQELYPDLLVGLNKHPGIGFILVKSEQFGNMVIGKGGICYLEDGKVEGVDPLRNYGPNAIRHLRREAGFTNCPDILVNAVYDPQTQTAYGFENQVSHHGGMGGPQNFAFVLHPSTLSTGDEPIVTAVGLHNVLMGWRDQADGKA